MFQLPLQLQHVGVPPIKCQGIKTKLVPFIFDNIAWDIEQGRWIEPFLGSGVVAFNLVPHNALLADSNQHIITFYKGIQAGKINRINVKEFLIAEGCKLAEGGADYYYEVRERFNKTSSPFDFLFLNRSCFNGVMRFNKSGHFNVPFGHKPLRFSPAYITKIVNQVDWVAKQMQGKNWQFQISNWQQTLNKAKPEDFVYADPPYLARHADYYNSWDEFEAVELANAIKKLPCGFALSMWQENKYRRNSHLDECWPTMEIKTHEHFYFVGSSEDFRNPMSEALVIKPGFARWPYHEFNDETNETSDFYTPKNQRTLATFKIGEAIA